MRLPVRASAIVIHDNSILLMERNKEDRHYFVIPGGGLEDTDASIEDAVVREVAEETSITVSVTKHLYTINTDERRLEYYLCDYISGEPKVAGANELRDNSEKNSYKPQWVSLNQITDIPLYPTEIRDCLLEDLTNDFKDTPREIFLLNK